MGLQKSDLPIPFNMDRVVRSVAVISSCKNTQSALWIGPRLLLSSLHNLVSNVGKDPTRWVLDDGLRRHNYAFEVESEITSQVLCSFSPKVELLKYFLEDDLVIFSLPDEYPPNRNWVEPDWLMQHGDFVFQAGRKVACVAYNVSISDTDGHGTRR